MQLPPTTNMTSPTVEKPPRPAPQVLASKAVERRTDAVEDQARDRRRGQDRRKRQVPISQLPQKRDRRRQSRRASRRSPAPIKAVLACTGDALTHQSRNSGSVVDEFV